MTVRIDRKKLMALMVEQDISVGSLAEKSKISIGTLSGIRAGRACSPSTASALALALGASLEKLAPDKTGGEK